MSTENAEQGVAAVRSKPWLGCDLIKAERERQITAEGYSANHDAGHSNGELAQAAACYALGTTVVRAPLIRDEKPDGSHQLIGFAYKKLWPWEARWWKPGDRVRELVKAGALIAAEIDRLQNNGSQHPNDVR